MVVDDVINDLKCGELSAHGMFANDKLSPANKNKLVLAINLGLLDLYTKFPLLTKEITIKQLPTVTTYKLEIFHAKSQGGNDYYIMDTLQDIFVGDVIRIEAVYDEAGCELKLNNTSECNVILTPTMDSLEIPHPASGEYLSVVYRAKHHQLTDTEHRIYLPNHLKSCLLNYVAHRIYSGSPAQDAMALSQMFYQKYMMEINDLNHNGFLNKDDGEKYEQFNRGGWI